MTVEDAACTWRDVEGIGLPAASRGSYAGSYCESSTADGIECTRGVGALVVNFPACMMKYRRQLSTKRTTGRWIRRGDR